MNDYADAKAALEKILRQLEKINPSAARSLQEGLSWQTHFEPSPASFMVNYIVDGLEALLDRLAKEGVHIDPKRQDESYGRFAWKYDPDGNKIELWQPHH
jgi:predicted enzyme related to lactoylglutathione lyase